jgi:hypothetical protein
MIANKDFFRQHEFVSKGLPILNDILKKSFDNEQKEKVLKPEVEGEGEDKKEESEDEEPNYSAMPEFLFEADRHRIIAAMIISDFFLFLLKHLKGNHVVQFIYLS